MIVFILSGVLLLGVCIFVHELGHLILAKMVGIKAKIFSIGYGKGIWKKKIGDTTWQITGIPLGGYVKFYGDDIIQRDKNVPHGFFSIGPWKRMIPVLGGPLFNLLLAFLIYIFIHLFYGSLVATIYLDENYQGQSAAIKAGLQNGDKVLEINGEKVDAFEDIQQKIVLSSGETLNFSIDRQGKLLELPVNPEKINNDLYRIGIRMPGETELRVNVSQIGLWRMKLQGMISETKPPISLRAFKWLRDGDIIKKVNGKDVNTSRQLQQELKASKENSLIHLQVERAVVPWLFSWPRRSTEVDVPIFYEYTVAIENLYDKKFQGEVESLLLFSGEKNHLRALNYVKINNKSAMSFQKLHEGYAISKTVDLELNERQYRGKIHVEKIGLLGFRPSQKIYEEYNKVKIDQVLFKSLEEIGSQFEIYGIVFSRMFAGRTSFLDNAAGPVRIFGIAGKAVELSLAIYLQLFAAISLALCIMNLLPIPILDGGHLLFYLIEGIRGKPLPTKWMLHIFHYSFLLLLALGLYILYKDFVWIFSF